MNNLSLQKLATFIAVAESGGFRRAAERLYKSQSAVSADIRQLETALGVALFHRTTRRVTLTREGERLLTRAKQALADLQSIVGELRDEVALQRGRVTVATSPTISTTRLPRVIADFSQAYPGIQIHVVEDFSTVVLDRVRNDEVDLAIGPRIDGARDFQFEPIMEDPFIALLPQNAMAAEFDGNAISLSDLARLPLICMPRASALRMTLELAFREQGLVLSPAFEVAHHLTLIAMVEAGLGATVLPAISLLPSHWRQQGSARAVRIVEPDLARTITITTRRGQVLAPAAERFAMQVRAEFSREPA
jgi:DNA-binding transcriptional LysR family regulator